MTKKQITLYVAAGLAVGLFLTACVGSASGQIDMPVAGGQLGIGPAVDMLETVSIEVGAPAQREMAWAADRMEREQADAPLALRSASQAQSQASAVMELEAEAFGCGLGH